MKKAIALVLALVMCLSLAACGGGNGKNKKMSKEEIVSAATPCDFGEIYNECQSNSVAASEEYGGQIYKVTGYVSEIKPDYIVVVPLNSPFTSTDSVQLMEVKAYLSVDDIKSVYKYEVINIAGVVSALVMGAQSSSALEIIMETAYYVDDIIEFSATVEYFVKNSTGKYHIMVLEGEPKIFAGSTTLVGNNRYEYVVEIVDPKSSGNITEATLDGVTLKKLDSATFTGRMRIVDGKSFYDGSRKQPIFEISEIISVTDLKKNEKPVE